MDNKKNKINPAEENSLAWEVLQDAKATIEFQRKLILALYCRAIMGAVMWLGVSAVVIASIVATKNLFTLAILILPAFLTLALLANTQKPKDKEEIENDKTKS